jgi:hypothetical protein
MATLLLFVLVIPTWKSSVMILHVEQVSEQDTDVMMTQDQSTKQSIGRVINGALALK